MVTIRTKKIALATTPTPPYPITEVVSFVCGLGPSSTKLEMALACKGALPVMFSTTIYSIS